MISMRRRAYVTELAYEGAQSCRGWWLSGGGRDTGTEKPFHWIPQVQGELVCRKRQRGRGWAIPGLGCSRRAARRRAAGWHTCTAFSEHTSGLVLPAALPC